MVALELRQKTLEIRLNFHGKDDFQTAHSHFSNGITRHDMKDYQLALESYRSALEVILKLYHGNHIATAQNYYHIGVTQHEIKITGQH